MSEFLSNHSLGSADVRFRGLGKSLPSPLSVIFCMALPPMEIGKLRMLEFHSVMNYSTSRDEDHFEGLDDPRDGDYEFPRMPMQRGHMSTRRANGLVRAMDDMKCTILM